MAVWCKSNAFVVKLLRFWNCIFFNVKNGCILGLNDNVGVGKFSLSSMICLEFQMVNGKLVIMCDEEDCDNLM